MTSKLDFRGLDGRRGEGGGESLDCGALFMLSTLRTEGLRQPVGPPEPKSDKFCKKMIRREYADLND